VKVKAPTRATASSKLYQTLADARVKWVMQLRQVSPIPKNIKQEKVNTPKVELAEDIAIK
jgi:hypothetical protein